MNFEEFLTEAVLLHDHSVGIVNKHAEGGKPQRDQFSHKKGGPKMTTHSVHPDHVQNHHHDLVKHGYKHSVSKTYGSSQYKKGGTTVVVSKHPDHSKSNSSGMGAGGRTNSKSHTLHTVSTYTTAKGYEGPRITNMEKK